MMLTKKISVGTAFLIILMVPTITAFGQTQIEEPKPEDIDVQITLDQPAKCAHVIVTGGGDGKYNAMFCTMINVSNIGIDPPCLFHPEISKNTSWSLVSPSLCEGIGDLYG